MRLLGYRLTQVGEGLAVFECEPGEQHYNPIGVVHGGLAMTLLDSAMGCCVHTRLPAGTGYTTLEVKVNLVRAITAKTGTIRATGKVIHFGGKTATAEGAARGRRGQALRPRHHHLHHPGAERLPLPARGAARGIRASAVAVADRDQRRAGSLSFSSR